MSQSWGITPNAWVYLSTHLHGFYSGTHSRLQAGDKGRYGSSVADNNQSVKPKQSTLCCVSFLQGLQSMILFTSTAKHTILYPKPPSVFHFQHLIVQYGRLWATAWWLVEHCVSLSAWYHQFINIIHLIWYCYILFWHTSSPFCPVCSTWCLFREPMQWTLDITLYL